MREDKSVTKDKRTWGDGPWQDEPDRFEWLHADFPCMMIRNLSGNWCGYVGVPPGHNCFGKGYDKIDSKVEVHGGLTFSGNGRPQESVVWPYPVWFLGFDTAHGFDFSPGRERRESAVTTLACVPKGSWSDRETYKDFSYCRGETERLAEQLRAIALKG